MGKNIENKKIDENVVNENIEENKKVDQNENLEKPIIENQIPSKNVSVEDFENFKNEQNNILNEALKKMEDSKNELATFLSDILKGKKSEDLDNGNVQTKKKW